MADKKKADISPGGTFLEEALLAIDPDVAKVFRAVAKASSLLSRSLPFRVGLTSGVNPSGDQQTVLDVYANDLFARNLLETGVVGEVASEEMEKPLTAPGLGVASLAVAMDPLDGSSNIVTNNPLGSIFGVWRGNLPQPGRKLVASIFVTYGPTLTLTLTAGKEVNQYVEVREGPAKDRFVLSHRAMKLPEKPEVYGVGGERGKWVPVVERFIQKLEARGMKLRYGGTFIGDFNQVLLRGGIFSYPALQGKPEGKLRILYETAPVSFLAERAGGSSTDGHRSILNVEPKGLADTCPFYVGSKPLITELESDFSNSPLRCGVKL